MIEGVQPDYGGFDPKFLGITLRFYAQNPDTWELYKRIEAASELPFELVKQGNAALQGGTAKAFEFFSLGTVLPHEARHFHDFLLSPYGNRIFRLRLMAAANGTQAAGSFKSADKFVPCPIPKWRRKTASEREVLAAGWRAQLNRDDHFEDFDVAPEYTTLFEQIENTYSRIKDHLHNPVTVRGEVSFQPCHIFEASALLVQIQHVYSVFGEPHANLFLNVIFNEPSARTYTMVVRLLATVWEKAGFQRDFNVMSAAISWTLFGDYERDGWSACPTERFVKLYGYLSDSGPPVPDTSCSDLFDEWTEALGVTSVTEALQSNAASNQRLVDKFDELFGGTWSKVFPEVMSGARALVAAHSHMALRFIEKPDDYVSPYGYFENMRNWVAAPVGVQFTGGAMRLNKGSLSGIKIHKAFDHDPNYLTVFRFYLDEPLPGVKLIDADLAQDLSDVISLTDFLFAEFNRDDPDFEIARQTLEEEGILPLEVLF